MMALVLWLAQIDLDGPSLPMATFEPMSRYIRCLFDRREDGGVLPPSAAARMALADAVIDACKPVRAVSAAAAEAILAADAHYSNPLDRSAAIQGFLAAWEQKLRFQIVGREAFLATDPDQESR